MPERSYVENGIRWPSVTEVLAELGLVPPYPPGPARSRGTAVHEAALLDDNCRLDEEATDARIVEVVRRYRAWRENMGGRYLASESPIISTELGLAGTPDRIVENGRGIGVVELKTGGRARWHRLQAAMYLMLARTRYQSASWASIVYLDEDPPGEIEVSSSDLEAAACAIKLYRWKNAAK